MSLFEKRLKDVVISYRRATDKKAFIAQTIQDCKKNLSDKDFDKKRNAAEILIFLYLKCPLMMKNLKIPNPELL